MWMSLYFSGVYIKFTDWSKLLNTSRNKESVFCMSWDVHVQSAMYSCTVVYRCHENIETIMCLCFICFCYGSSGLLSLCWRRAGASVLISHLNKLLLKSLCTKSYPKSILFRLQLVTFVKIKYIIWQHN